MRRGNNSKRKARSRWDDFNQKREKADKSLHVDWADQQLTLNFHSQQFSTSELILKPEVFSSVKPRDIIEIVPLDPGIQPFIVQATEQSLSNKGITSLSISWQMGTALNIYHLRSVEVQVKMPAEQQYELDWVLVSIKDRAMSRADMWQLSVHWVGCVLHKHQRIASGGFRVEVSELLKNDQPVLTGIVTKNTVVSFKTRSCKLVWLVEITKEMYEYSPTGQLYIEHAHRFIGTSLERQTIKGTTHEVSVVFFSRLYFPTVHSDTQYSTDGNMQSYVDVYKEVVRISDVKGAWKEALKILKHEYMYFPSLLNWKFDRPKCVKAFIQQFPVSGYSVSPPTHPGLKCVGGIDLVKSGFPQSAVAQSHSTCFLQALNFCLTQLTEEDKHCTSASLTVISAGSAVYFTGKSLTKITKERVLTRNMSVNLVNLKRKPLHQVPLFVYKRVAPQEKPGHKNIVLRFTFEREVAQCSSPYWLKTFWFYSFTQLEGCCNIQSANHTITHDRARAFTPLFPLFRSTPRPQIGDLSLTIAGVSDRVSDTSTASYLSVMNRPMRRRPKPLLSESRPRFGLGSIAGEKQEDSARRKDSADSTGKVVVTPRHNSSDVLPYKRQNSFDFTTTELRPPDFRRRASSLRRRWNLAFPQCLLPPDAMFVDDALLYSTEVLELYEKIWTYLLEPPLLPLYNDYWPRDAERGISSPYTLYCSNAVGRDNAILKLIKYRLNNGFQLVYFRAADQFCRRTAATSISLSMGNSYHTVSPSEDGDLNIDFTIYLPECQVMSSNARVAYFSLSAKDFEVKNTAFYYNYYQNWDCIDDSILNEGAHVDN